ncbi:MAG: glycosyltransferase [Bacteroidota bacterium]
MKTTSNTTSNIKLLVFDSHPVQYRTPIWQALHKIAPDSIHVAYATIYSAESHHDEEFGQEIEWNNSLLEGYPYTVLNDKKNLPLSGWNSLTGKGVKTILEQLKPQAILLTGFNYRFNHIILWEAKKRNISIHLRCETQDEAFSRSPLKQWIRTFYYKTMYRFISCFYYVGELNRQHYLNHNVTADKLVSTPYFAINYFTHLTNAQKKTQKDLSRESYGFEKDSYIIGFSGKLISKKNPEILFQIIDHLPDELKSKIVLYFIGSGELQANLMMLASQYHDKYNTRTIFTGFVNQSQIVQHYLTIDMLVLPSKQMGETWGLVANEAMQAGCSVIVSNHVGCGANFKNWERFEIFQDEDIEELTQKVQVLMKYKRNFDWANDHLKDYSLEHCVDQIVNNLATNISPSNSSNFPALSPSEC